MLSQCCFHFLLLPVVWFQLRSIGRSSYTSLSHFLMLAAAGAFAAIFFALLLSIVLEGRASAHFVLHGFALQGSFFLFASAFLMYRQKKSNGKRRRTMPSLILLFGCIYSGLVIDALLIEPTALIIRETTITTSKITKPITIVFCTDMQADHIGRYERRTLQKIKEQNADLILFGGDYLQCETVEEGRQLLKDWNQLFREIDLQAPLGIYAVEGNVGSTKGLFDKTAISFRQSTMAEQIGEIRVTFLSLADSGEKNAIPDEERKDQFRIIVGHRPKFAMASQEADLLLAGHTHGGQVQIPFFGPLVTASGDFPKQWASGKTVMRSGVVLIVSNGSGLERARAPRVRFYCRPDFWIIKIVPEKRYRH